MAENQATEQFILRGQKSTNQLKALLAKILPSKGDRVDSVVEALLTDINDSFSQALDSLRFRRPYDQVIPVQSDAPCSTHRGNTMNSGERSLMQSAPKRSGQRTRVDALCTKVFQRTGQDGYRWRKYGEKEISGAKFKRSYFNCVHKSGLGCAAKRQVQQSETDPSMLEITYLSEHTCTQRSSLYTINFDPSKAGRSDLVATEVPSAQHGGTLTLQSSSLWISDNQDHATDIRPARCSNTEVPTDQPSTSLKEQVLIIPSPTCSQSELLEFAEVPELTTFDRHPSVSVDNCDVPSSVPSSPPPPLTRHERNGLVGAHLPSFSVSDLVVPEG